MILQIPLPSRLEELAAAVELSGPSLLQKKGETVLLQYKQSSKFTEIKKEIARMVHILATPATELIKKTRFQLFKRKSPLGQT
jgi:ribosomal protein L29